MEASKLVKRKTAGKINESGFIGLHHGYWFSTALNFISKEKAFFLTSSVSKIELAFHPQIIISN